MNANTNREAAIGLFHLVFAAMAATPKLHKILDRNGPVSLKHVTLLRRLSAGEMTMTAIARYLGDSTAAATGSVDRLEKLGYAERSHAADDRRKVVVRITTQGLEFVAGSARDVAAAFADALPGKGEIRVPSLTETPLGKLSSLLNGMVVAA